MAMGGAKLKAAYSIPELAQMAGVSRYRMLRLIESNGIEVRRNGRVFVVYLSALRRALPDLWDSILDRSAVE